MMQSQQLVASLSVVSNLIGGIITCLVILFLGPWSDSSGRRKPIIVFAIIGMITTSVGLLILQAFPNLSTIWAIYIEVLPLSIGGSKPLFMMAVFSYLGDICLKTGRCTTTIMGSNTAMISASTIVGSILAPVLLRNTGFIGVFSLSAILEFSSLVYAWWRVKDFNVSEKIPSVFDLSLPIQSFKCLFKKRQGHKRKNVLLMVFLPSTTTLTFSTEIILLYLYLRYKFQWTEVEYGIFSAFRGITQFLGAIIVVKLLKHKLKLEDETIGLVGGFSQLAGSAVLFFSFKPWMIFLAPLFGILGRGVLIADKPVLLKQIKANEQGRLNSITALLDKGLALAVLPLAHYVYSATLSWMPNCFLLLSLLAACMQIMCYSLLTTEHQGHAET